MGNRLGLNAEEQAVLKKLVHKVVDKYIDFVLGTNVGEAS